MQEKKNTRVTLYSSTFGRKFKAENADPCKLARAFSAKKEKQDLKIEKKNLSLVKKKLVRTSKGGDRPWWPSGLEHASNSSRHSLKALGLDPRSEL